ncbi:MAG: hypothetical protein ABMA26_17840 [Limisphaerales bacterium]
MKELKRLVKPTALAVVATMMLLHAAFADEGGGGGEATPEPPAAFNVTEGNGADCTSLLENTYCIGWDQFNTMFSWCCRLPSECGTVSTVYEYPLDPVTTATCVLAP